MRLGSSFVAYFSALLLAGCGSTPAPRQRPTTTASGYSAVLPIAKDAARRHGLPLSFVLGVIHVESRFRSDARSGAGAQGLMQLMPKTAAALARRLGYEDFTITDPLFNVDAGTAYLAYLLKRYDGDSALALAAYNTGPGRVSRWQRRGRALPAYSLRYVAAVQRAQNHYATLANKPGLESTTDPVAAPPADLDRKGLRTLLQNELYGDRGDQPPNTLDRPEER